MTLRKFHVSFFVFTHTFPFNTLLRDMDVGSHFNNHKNWVKHYRCTQILVSEVNDFVRDILLPVYISWVLTVVVLLNYILIRLRLATQILITLTLVDLLIFSNLVILLSKGSDVTAIQKDALALKKGMPGQSKVQKLELMSLRNLYIGIGSLGRIDEDTRQAVYMTIVDYTADMLVTF